MNEGTWYRTGTVSLTNGSDLVNGVGTAFIDNVFVGGIFFSPTGLHEVTRVISDVQLQLVMVYAGPTVAGAEFAVAPTQGAVVAATRQLQAFLTTLGPLKQAWEAGDLNPKGLALKGVKDTVGDLPASGNIAGDGWIVDQVLYVWTGVTWYNAGLIGVTPELQALRDDAVAAKDVVVEVAGAFGDVDGAITVATEKANVATAAVVAVGTDRVAIAADRVAAQAALVGAVAAAALVGDFRLKVDAVAGMAAQPDNKACTVSADTAANNGYYVKRGGELKRESADTMQAIALRNFLFEADGDWLLKFQHKVSELLHVLCFSIDRSGETYLRLRSDAEFGPGLLSNRLVPPGVGSLIDVLAGALSVPKGLSIDGSKIEFYRNEDYGLVMLDSNRKAGDLAYGRDGLLKDEVVKRLTARLSPDDLSPAFLARLQSQTSYVAQITGVSPNRRLYVDDAAGTRRLIASTGDPRDAQVLPSGHVMWTDATGQALYAPCVGGATYPVYPTGGVSYGDSLTKSDDTNWPGLVGTALGVPWVNAGIGGQASSDIVLRQGGLVPTVVVTGGSIPASGPVVLTMTPTDAWSTAIPGSSFSFSGSIAGVAGTLTHTHTTNVWTFTRTVDGAAVAAPDGTKFVVSTPTYDTRVQTLFFGYNNQYSTGTRYTVIRDYALAVANIKTYVKRYLVFGLVNSAVEPNGSDGLADVLAINAQLAATYGAHYFDYRTWLLNDAMGAAGIAWTANDIADKAAGVVPRSLRIPGPPLDPVHLVPAGYAAIAPKVVALMTNLGWF